METIKYKSNHATLPEIAKVISDAFPELENRSIAVTGVDVDEDQQKSIAMPFALVALRQGDTSGSATLGGRARINLRDDIVIEFSFAVKKYTKANKQETTLWAYYDFETIRDRLFEALIEFSSEHEISFEFVTLDVSSDQNAVYIEFRFRQDYQWCRPDTVADGVITGVSFALTTEDGCKWES